EPVGCPGKLVPVLVEVAAHLAPCRLRSVRLRARAHRRSRKAGGEIPSFAGSRTDQPDSGSTRPRCTGRKRSRGHEITDPSEDGSATTGDSLVVSAPCRIR